MTEPSTKYAQPDFSIHELDFRDDIGPKKGPKWSITTRS
jgi:hypothetical protein